MLSLSLSLPPPPNANTGGPLKLKNCVADRPTGVGLIVQKLCESWGGRPGLSALTSLLVFVDLRLYIEPCFGIGLSLSLICQPTSEDIKQHYLPTWSRPWRWKGDSKRLDACFGEAGWGGRVGSDAPKRLFMKEVGLSQSFLSVGFTRLRSSRSKYNTSANNYWLFILILSSALQPKKKYYYWETVYSLAVLPVNCGRSFPR